SSDYSSILWDNGETTETISVGMPGNYAFTITPTDPDCDPIRDSIRISNQGGGVWITSFDDGIPNPCITEGIVFFSLNLPLADFGISWDDGPIVVAGNSYMVHDDELHNLKVYKDDCIVIDTNFSLEFPNALTVDPIVFNVTCFGESDGQITTNVSGGFGNYEYEFNNSGISDLFGEYRNLAPGTYEISVLDRPIGTSSPCREIITVEITEPEPFTVEVDTTQVIPPSCSGDADGSMMLVMMGGNPGTKDIRYTYSGGAGRTTELMLDSLRASRYDIRVQDSMGCTANTTYTLEDPSPV